LKAFDTVNYTVRFPADLYKSMQYVALYRGFSVNTLILESCRREVATTHVELPNDLLLAQTASE
jgi:hypothetical protein